MGNPTDVTVAAPISSGGGESVGAGGNRDWLVTAAKFGAAQVVAYKLAAASKNLTWLVAARAVLTELVSANEASEIMTGIALRSAVTTTILSAVPAYVVGETMQVELYLYDRAVTSLTNDIYTVLLRSR